MVHKPITCHVATEVLVNSVFHPSHCLLLVSVSVLPGHSLPWGIALPVCLVWVWERFKVNHTFPTGTPLLKRWNCKFSHSSNKKSGALGRVRSFRGDSSHWAGRGGNTDTEGLASNVFMCFWTKTVFSQCFSVTCKQVWKKSSAAEK